MAEIFLQKWIKLGTDTKIRCTILELIYIKLN